MDESAPSQLDAVESAAMEQMVDATDADVECSSGLTPADEESGAGSVH